MKRIQLFEFEDFQWFPAVIRNSMTNLIVVFHKMMGSSQTLAIIFEELSAKLTFDQIVDMGSGAGGAMPEAIRILNEKNSNSPVDLLLTDLHPNSKFIHSINAKNTPHLKYQKNSLDATQLANTPDGLKTMIASFHHMPPTQAKAILQSAQENKQAIFIYELAENNIPTIIWWLLLPLSLTILFIMCLFMTPFVRPMTWQQIIFTYLIPIIPICYAWDGQASLVRTYTFQDLEQIITDIQTPDYRWEMQVAKNVKGKKAGYYLLGYSNS